METGTETKFYFRAQDIDDLLKAGATHIMITITPGYTGEPASANADGYTPDATSAGPSKPGCPWPCGGITTTITKDSLEQADKSLS